MNILFLSIGNLDNIEQKGIYIDLIREFISKEHNLYVVHPLERRLNRKTELVTDCGAKVLKVKIGNITKTNLIEKGLSTLLVETMFLKQIKKHFSNIKFDLILYSTPPITFEKVVSYIKKRDDAKSYLLLKDIFPQNAVDLNMFSKRSLFYKFFRRKEVKLYNKSDYIGCMSEENRQYVLKHNGYLEETKVEISPNTIDPIDIIGVNKREVRKKYNLPLDKTIFIYGGNLGKPQGVDFIIECLKSADKYPGAYFLIVGSGTEYHKIESFVINEKPSNVQLVDYLSKTDYDQLVYSCDVGLVFLDYNFTIPNFPSRILSYMEASIPILACTDPNTDVGKIIQEKGFGYWTLSNNIDAFYEKIDAMLDEKMRKKMGKKARNYLLENYHVNNSYEIIMKHFE